MEEGCLMGECSPEGQLLSTFTYVLSTCAVPRTSPSHPIKLRTMPRPNVGLAPSGEGHRFYQSSGMAHPYSKYLSETILVCH